MEVLTLLEPRGAAARPCPELRRSSHLALLSMSMSSEVALADGPDGPAVAELRCGGAGWEKEEEAGVGCVGGTGLDPVSLSPLPTPPPAPGATGGRGRGLERGGQQRFA